MKIGSPLWKLKLRVRRQPWLILAPLLLLIVVLLGSCATQSIRTLSAAASLLWLLFGVLIGFVIGKLFSSVGSKSKTPPFRRPGRWR